MPITTFGVCSFNIGGLVGWTRSMMEKFRLHMGLICQANSVLCFQEVGPLCLQRRVPVLNDKHFTLHVSYEGIVTFVNETKFNVLGVTTEQVWANAKSRYTEWRRVVCVALQETQTGLNVVVGNNHTHDGRGTHQIKRTSSRMATYFNVGHARQAGAVVKAVAASHGALPILVGDHNLFGGGDQHERSRTATCEMGLRWFIDEQQRLGLFFLRLLSNVRAVHVFSSRTTTIMSRWSFAFLRRGRNQCRAPQVPHRLVLLRPAYQCRLAPRQCRRALRKNLRLS